MTSSFWLRLVLTHDLSCTLDSLARAAARSHPASPPLPRTAPTRDLLIAAIAFTIQFAIDETGQDPAEMRALERELIAKLEEPGAAEEA